jgi:beta-lactamase regulating signal transducer with metallopeptidase domain
MSLSSWQLLLVGVENFVLINAALSTAAFGVAFLARLYKLKRTTYPLSSARLYAAALVIPPIVSAWLVGASLLPVTWLGTQQWEQEHINSHSSHLFNALTAPLDPVLGYIALAFILSMTLTVCYVAVNSYFRIGLVVRRLDIGAEPASPEKVKQVEDVCTRHGIDVGLVMSSYPFSFMWGYWRSKLVVSTGLLNALTSEELAALLEHEAAHHARRDNLSKWVLTICRYTSPAFPFTNLLYRWWCEQVEMVCDEVAACRTKAPVEVACALVRLRRLTLAVAPRRSQLVQSSFMDQFNDNHDSFEHRVIRVLSLADSSESSEPNLLCRSWAKSAATMSVTFAITLAVVFLLSPLVIHRIVEFLLHV